MGLTKEEGHLNRGERTCCSPWDNNIFRGSARPEHHTKIRVVVTYQGKNFAAATCELVSRIASPYLQGLAGAWPPVPTLASLGSPQHHDCWAKIKGDPRHVVGLSWQL